MMCEDYLTPGAATATVAIVGFAIQRALELLDPLVNILAKRLSEHFPRPPQPPQPPSPPSPPSPLTEAAWKTWLMVMAAFIFALIFVLLSGFGLLGYVNEDWSCEFYDTLVTALVLSAGTEGLNIVLKYFGYVKEGRKQRLDSAISVEIVPSDVTVNVKQTLQFRADVRNSQDQSVSWKRIHSNAGSVNPDGLYSAPSEPGSFMIVATSKADPTKYATATVTVTESESATISDTNESSS